MNQTLHLGDCMDVLKTLPDDSVDSVITDPPYHLTSIVKRFGKVKMDDDTKTSERGRAGADAMARLTKGFMGKTWDGGDIAFRPELWAEIMRVLKPGGYLLAFSHTRTYHRMAVAIEDAGFEIRDMLDWLYGSGFPKSQNVARNIDKHLGVAPTVIGKGKKAKPTFHSKDIGGVAEPGEYDITAPTSAEAKQWAGWGTGLKPAKEPICMARKPLRGSIAANVLEYGTGAINIDGCRIDLGDDFQDRPQRSGGTDSSTVTLNVPGHTQPMYDAAGRYPANLVHDGSEEVLNLLPIDGDGSVARFFYSAKADADDKNLGVDGKNTHPTVKPVDLMRWMCRLVTRPGGTVLDPFMGSGSTGRAALMEGMNFIGFERDAEYMAIAESRLRYLTDPSYNPAKTDTDGLKVHATLFDFLETKKESA